MNTLHQLPGKRAEEQIMKEPSYHSAEGIRRRDKCAVNGDQEEELSQAQSQSQLAVNVMELCVQSVEEQGR